MKQNEREIIRAGGGVIQHGDGETAELLFQPKVDYFDVTAWPEVCYSVLIWMTLEPRSTCP